MASVQTEELTSTDRENNGLRVRARRSEKYHYPKISSPLLTHPNPKDMQVRRWLSTAEVARCSFKDKAISEVDVFSCDILAYNVLTPIQVITLAYQVVIDAMTKCLRLFAEDQQFVHFSSPFVHR